MDGSHRDEPVVVVAVPEGTPDPVADRRFAEGRYPLLEPVGWSGERHRGGYGLQRPGDETTSLGLVFGPPRRDGSGPRLAISVGSSFGHAQSVRSVVGHRRRDPARTSDGPPSS